MWKEGQCVFPKKIKEIKKKVKKKKKKKKKKIATLCLKPEHGPSGIWQKPLKPGALNLHWLGVTDLVFATRVDGWILASSRCWRLEIIWSPG